MPDDKQKTPFYKRWLGRSSDDQPPPQSHDDDVIETAATDFEASREALEGSDDAVAGPSDPEMPPISVVVTLSSPEDGGRIHYTLDGSTPNESSPLYDPEQPLLLDNDATLKACAFKEEHDRTVATEEEYDMQKAEWEENEPEDRSDEVLHEHLKEQTLRNGWRLAGASVRGKLHAHRGLWREDHFDFKVAGGWTVIAVSDGAGSASLSRVGARLVCEAALEHMAGGLAEFGFSSESKEDLELVELPILQGLLIDANRKALKAIRDEASIRDREPEDFAATLLIVVHHTWHGRHVVGAIQVGDGSVALLDWDGDLTMLGVPDHGEQSGETRFLTTAGVEEDLDRRVLFSHKSHLRCIAVMSDGVSDDFFPEEKRLAELLVGGDFSGMIGHDERPVRGVMETVTGDEEQKDRLLSEWLRYNKRGSSDDRTLVLFWEEGT